MKCEKCYGEIVNGVCIRCGARVKKRSREPIPLSNLAYFVSGATPGPVNTMTREPTQVKKLTVVGEATDMVCHLGLQPGYRMYAYEFYNSEYTTSTWHKLTDSVIRAIVRGEVDSQDRDILYVAVAESGELAVVASKCKLRLAPMCGRLATIRRLEEFILENVDTSCVKSIWEPFGMYAVKRTNLYDLPMPLLEDIKDGICCGDSTDKIDIFHSWNTLSFIKSLVSHGNRLRVLNLPNFRNDDTHPVEVDGLVSYCKLLQEVIMPHINMDNVVGDLFKKAQDIPLWLDLGQETYFNPDTFYTLYEKVFNDATLDVCSRECLSENWFGDPSDPSMPFEKKWQATYIRLLCWRNCCERKRDDTKVRGKKQYAEDARIGLILKYKGESVNVLSDEFMFRFRGQVSVAAAEYCEYIFKTYKYKYGDLPPTIDAFIEYNSESGLW